MNQPTPQKNKDISANFKFRKRLSTEETLLNEIRKFTSLPLSTHQSQCPQHITGFSSSSNKINIEEHLYF